MLLLLGQNFSHQLSFIATAKVVRTLLIAESLDVGAGLQICSITNNNFHQPAPTWFLLSTPYSTLVVRRFKYLSIKRRATMSSMGRGGCLMPCGKSFVSPLGGYICQ